MSYRRPDIVARAVEVLDTYGLADLTMRRLGGELGVRPSALYHHFASKQTLLAAVADEVLARGRAPRDTPPDTVRDGSWDDRVVAVCTELREAMLAYRDGAELVATVHAFGLGAAAPGRDLAAALADSGLDPALAGTATRTLLHFVFGHTLDEQTHLQAGSAGAIEDQPRERSDFAAGLGIVVDGIRLRCRVAPPPRGRGAGSGAGLGPP